MQCLESYRQRLGLSDFDHIDPVCEAVNKNIHREDDDWLSSHCAALPGDDRVMKHSIISCSACCHCCCFQRVYFSRFSHSGRCGLEKKEAMFDRILLLFLLMRFFFLFLLKLVRNVPD